MDRHHLYNTTDTHFKGSYSALIIILLGLMFCACMVKYYDKKNRNINRNIERIDNSPPPVQNNLPAYEQVDNPPSYESIT